MDLGELIAIYPAYALRRRVYLGMAVAFIFFVLLPAGYGVYLLDYGMSHFGPAAGSAWGYPWLEAAALALVAWIVLVLLAYRAAHRKVEIFQNGLRLTGFGLWLISRQLSWDDLSGISVEMVAARPDGYGRLHAWLYPQKGARINIAEDRAAGAGLTQLAELVTRIKSRLYPHLYPLLFTRFCAGQWLSFGPLSVHRDGLHLPGDSNDISWNQVHRITIQSGFLVVELGHPEKGNASPACKTCRLPVSRLPNVELLLQIVEQR